MTTHGARRRGSRHECPLVQGCCVLAALEFSWSYHLDPLEGTSTPLSSAVLQLAHAVLIAGCWLAPPAPVYALDESESTAASARRRD